MAEPSPRDQLELHEFSVRYRAALAQRHMTSEQSMDTVRDAVRQQYEQEKQAQRGPSVEPSSPTPERQPEEPERE
jgi:hypothetical protein